VTREVETRVRIILLHRRITLLGCLAEAKIETQAGTSASQGFSCGVPLQPHRRGDVAQRFHSTLNGVCASLTAAQAGRLWDTYLSETAADFAEFLVYCGAALLLTWADEMKGMEFQVRHPSLRLDSALPSPLTSLASHPSPRHLSPNEADQANPGWTHFAPTHPVADDSDGGLQRSLGLFTHLFATPHAHGPDRSLCSSPAHQALNARVDSHQACMKSTRIWVWQRARESCYGLWCGRLLTRGGWAFRQHTTGPSHLPPASAHAAVGRGAAGDGLVQGVPLALRLRLRTVSSVAKLVPTFCFCCS
jgi:hypothetical protein